MWGGVKDDPDPQQKQQTIVYDGADLGEGLDLRYDDPSKAATNHRCISGEKGVQNIGEWTARAFYTRNQDDVERYLETKVEGDVETKDAEVGLDLSGDWGYEKNETERRFSVLVRARTVLQKYDVFAPEEYDDDPGNLCSTDPGWETKDFPDHCGSSYLESEVMGGYVVLHTSVSSLNEKQERNLNGKFEVGAGPKGSATVSGAMNWLKSQSFSSLKFNITAHGIRGPKSSLLTSDGKITAGNMLNYLNNVQSDYSTPMNNDKIDAYSYGTVIEQRLQRYSEEQIQACGIEEIQPLKCYTGFRNRATEVERDRDWIDGQIDEVQWKVDHPNRVDWPRTDNGSNTALQQYQDAITDTNTCLNQEIPNAETTCQNAFDDFENVCDNCRFPEGCSPYDIRKRLNDLPNAPVTTQDGLRTLNVSGRGAETIGQIDQAGSYGYDDVCFLNQVTGKFDAGGDKAVLQPDTVAEKWKLDVESNDNDDGKEVRAGAHCVAADAFYNPNDSTPGWERSLYTETISSGGTVGVNKLSVQSMSSTTYPAALTGLEGGLDSTDAEGAALESASTTDTANGSRRLSLYTDGATKLRGWGVSWGLDNPGSGPSFAKSAKVQSGGQQTASLAEVDNAMCYLTDVSGEFEGTAESVDLKRKSGRWVLEVDGYCDRGFLGLAEDCVERTPVQATARCYEYSQSH